MSVDERPKPEYGEYASDAEWETAIKRSGAELPPKTLVPDSTVAPTPTPTQSSSSRGAGGSRPHPVDRLVSLFLLSFGLVSVIAGAGGYFDMATTMESTFGQLGVGEYTPTALTPVFGVLIVVSQSLLWIVTALWSYFRLRAGRLTFWLPLAGGLVSFIISAVLLGVLLASDPAFLAFTTSA